MIFNRVNYFIMLTIRGIPMNRLTSHERLMRIFRGEEIDRPALKLWGAGATVGWQLHEASLRRTPAVNCPTG